jgi:hypothetical protein
MGIAWTRTWDSEESSFHESMLRHQTASRTKTMFNMSQISPQGWTRCGNKCTYTQLTISFSFLTTHSQHEPNITHRVCKVLNASFILGGRPRPLQRLNAVNNQRNTKHISRVGWKSSASCCSKQILTQLDPIVLALPLSCVDIILVNVEHYVYGCTVSPLTTEIIYICIYVNKYICGNFWFVLLDKYSPAKHRVHPL